MLRINMEFRKGILFVRLYGKLIRDTTLEFQEEVIDRIQENGLHTVVINIEGLEELDIKGINSLLYCYESCKKNRGTALLCGINRETIKNRLTKERVLKYMFQITNELDALNKIKI